MTQSTSIWGIWHELPEYRTLLDHLKKGTRELLCFGFPGDGLAQLAAAVWRETGRAQLIVTPDWSTAQRVADVLAGWTDPEQVLAFPPADLVPYGVAAQSRDLAAGRLAVLARCLTAEEEGWSPLVVAPLAAVLRGMTPPAAVRELRFPLRVGEAVGLEETARRLLDLGYERVEPVEAPGQFAIRGGILDLFPVDRANPLRVEFFDVEVDGIREFDVISQRSVAPLEEVWVGPAREAVAAPALRAQALRRLEDELAAVVNRLQQGNHPEAARHLSEHVGERIEGLRHGGSNWETFLPYLYPEMAWLLDYLPGRPLVWLADPSRIDERGHDIERERRERFSGLLESGQMLAGQLELLRGMDQLRKRLRSVQTIQAGLFSRAAAGTSPLTLSFAAKEMPPFHGQWELFLEEVRRWHEGRYRLLMFVGDAERAARIVKDLDEAGIPAYAQVEGWPELTPGAMAIAVAPVPRGLEWSPLRLVIIGEQDILGHRSRAKKRRPRAQAGASPALRLTSLDDLNVGDYVVHVSHGIGQYLGTRTMTVQDVQRDYLLIKYEGQDRLYVPTDQIELIQKYIGGEAARPKLYRLGGNEWAKVKQRVKESVQAMAEELMELYHARKSVQGHAFAPDSMWQREFEAAFPYEETPDQARAIAEVKADMEVPTPMDRLLCGDVGYGKTEVAIRAAFKAVMDGKQVAVLVPTTILAEQHYLTFKERFEGFPVRVAMLSRFRSRAEQEQTVTGLRTGAVDVVIGTHRMIQGDIAFKDLGLVIVDEEQRFGVQHKERLKHLRRTVDVLTLTATPIPRTLHMAMTGLRDLSVIETPPMNRYPVETYVLEYNDAIVRDAIERELARRGQVFYLHNRVRSIERVADHLRKLVPQADIVVAHGQMPEDKLERVMVEFLEGQHDVLLCTTIIESGLDMPNVNTLIVEEADKFGLAQLYQIRGRVGRSDRLAYAYFTFKRDKTLTEIAEKRLQAIKDFTELGSGFKIALRDLEIRGAGNILGAEQHGFVASVGFDLYAQMLEESVRELKGERVVPTTEATIELRVDAFIPDEYVSDPRHKLDVYKKINRVRSEDDARDIEEELIDRFGEYPEGVANLLATARLKLRATALGVLAVTQDGQHVRFAFPGYLEELAVRGGELAAKLLGRRLTVQRRPKPALVWKLAGGGAKTLFDELNQVLDHFEQAPEVRRWRQDVEVQV